MPYLEVKDEPVYYIARRKATVGSTPLVFVHGAGGSHQHWLYVLRALPQAACFVPDLPGHGRSAGTGRKSVGAYADWLVAFLNALGLEQAVLVGHSLGGAVALDLALRYPERVAGLGLVGTGARLRVAPAILDGLRDEFRPTVRLICEWCYGQDAPPEVLTLGEGQMAATPPGVVHDDFCAANAFDVFGRLAEISAPAVIVTGTQDRMTPPKYAVYLRDRLPNATLHLVDGAGHMVMIEQPEAVVEALAPFQHTNELP
jgi:pimeloyl-ACP methyl ester carboxylesterase